MRGQTNLRRLLFDVPIIGAGCNMCGAYNRNIDKVTEESAHT